MVLIHEVDVNGNPIVGVKLRQYKRYNLKQFQSQQTMDTRLKSWESEDELDFNYVAQSRLKSVSVENQ